ncbi:MAG: riboflavin synthase [Desulfomonile sp.]|nr:riboflavin synthase [Desulfomonile sp.]
MFTGIIEARGRIASMERSGEFTLIRIRSEMDLSDVRVGDSICVNGACLTATGVAPAAGEFVADVSPETLRVTTLGDLKIGDRVNLEKAMRLDARLGGHLLLGHVDCVGRLIDKRSAGNGFSLGFAADSGRYLIEKGSVAVDGVSLTVNRVEGARFWVMIIPHTAAMTGLTEKNVNDKVNLEFDIIGKYVEKFVSGRDQRSGVDEKTLRDYGFM